MPTIYRILKPAPRYRDERLIAGLPLSEAEIQHRWPDDFIREAEGENRRIERSDLGRRLAFTTKQGQLELPF